MHPATPNTEKTSKKTHEKHSTDSSTTPHSPPSQTCTQLYFGSTCTPAAMNRTQRGDGSASNTAAPSTTGGRQAAPTPQAVGAGADVAARRRGGSRSVTSTRARSESTPPRAPPRPGQARAPPGPTPLPVPGPVVMPPASKGATTRQATSRGQLAPGVVEPERAPKYASRWDEARGPHSTRFFVAPPRLSWGPFPEFGPLPLNFRFTFGKHDAHAAGSGEGLSVLSACFGKHSALHSLISDQQLGCCGEFSK